MSNKKYEVVFKKSALKELEALPLKFKLRLLDAIQMLAVNPFSDVLDVKKLKSYDGAYRLRVQTYRVIYLVNKSSIQIVIIKVGTRSEIY